jgi:hypothetical protein
MKQLRWIFAGALWAPVAGASAPDFSKVPEQFCKQALEVAEETSDCPGNSTFLREAQACVDKLNALEANLGAEAVQIAQGGAQAQLGKISTGGSEYDFSAGAFRYLHSVATVAARELAQYPEYVFLPADHYDAATPDQIHGGAMEAGCYAEPQRRIAQAREELARKLATYAARYADSVRNRATLAVAGGNLAARSASAAATYGAGGVRVAGAMKQNSASDITGVHEDALKQASR